MMLWWCCDDDVMTMLWGCCEDVVIMLWWWCYGDVVMMSWWCCDDAMMMLYYVVMMMVCWCYDDVTLMLRCHYDLPCFSNWSTRTSDSVPYCQYHVRRLGWRSVANHPFGDSFRHTHKSTKAGEGYSREWPRATAKKRSLKIGPTPLPQLRSQQLIFVKLKITPEDQTHVLLIGNTYIHCTKQENDMTLRADDFGLRSVVMHNKQH